MNNPYFFKKLTFNEGSFDNSIDATYIIHLEGNQQRYENILYQLTKFVPTKTVYILFNKGMKYKPSYINTTAKDLVDCYITIFKHNIENNILVLEDDFIWLSNINNYHNHINDFCYKNNSNFAFYLGTFPFLFIPESYYIYQGIFNIFTHSIIYSKSLQSKILDYNYKIITDWDIFMNTFITNKYYFYKPLCGQTFMKTENSKTWIVYNTPVYDLFFIINNFFYSNIYPEQLFNFFYLISYIIVIIILFCIYYNKNIIPYIPYKGFIIPIIPYNSLYTI